MFFGRTEKSGTQNCLHCRTEMSAKSKLFLSRKNKNIGKNGNPRENEVLKLHTSLHTFEVCNNLCNCRNVCKKLHTSLHTLIIR